MPKNKGKGGKNRRRGKNENEEKRELLMKEEGQAYAQVTKMLGSGRVMTYCFQDGKARMARIVGSMKKKQWIILNDIVLLGLRDYEDDKADIIAKYSLEEARQLKDLKEIPETVNLIEASAADTTTDDLNIEFRGPTDVEKAGVAGKGASVDVDDDFINDL